MRIQRKEETANEAPPIVQEVLSSSGRPLDSDTRAFMEPRFGHDFSQVRVHTGERAVESAQAVNARAYTVGQEVVFGEGQYEPKTGEGKRLLAHELTHVVQQGAGPVTGVAVNDGLSISDPSDSLELAASSVANRVMAGLPYTASDGQVAITTPVQRHTSHVSLQRFPAGDKGHGGIENEALVKAGFTPDEASKVYFGNWLRDLSQLPPCAVPLINILALGEFDREVNREDLGTYVPSEHLDNPQGGDTTEDPTLKGAKESQEAFNKLSSAQRAAYEEEQAHIGEVQAAAKESGLPEYIELGKFHVKRKLTEAIDKGRTDEGMRAMGDGLHAIEDYFAHSNFVEVAIWNLREKPTQTQYDNLKGTNQPAIITGTYAPGANDWVSRFELITTEIENGQLTKAFVKGWLRKNGITDRDVLKKLGENLGGTAGGLVGATAGSASGGISGAERGADEGWSQHSGWRAGWYGFTGLFSGGVKGMAEGASAGWQFGSSIGLTEILTAFPEIRIAITEMIASVRSSSLALLKRAAEFETDESAKEAEKKKLSGPTHSEIAKDSPHHQLHDIAMELAKDVDLKIGEAMLDAWKEKELEDQAVAISRPASPELTERVTRLVDTFVSHPARDPWWRVPLSKAMKL